MSLEDDVRVRLLADGTVSGLIGARMHPGLLPQNPAVPALTYERISGPRIQSLTGPSGRGVARLQIDSWSSTYREAQSLAAAVRASLNGFIGNLSDGASPPQTRGVVIRLDNERDLHEEDVSLFRISQDYVINHEE